MNEENRNEMTETEAVDREIAEELEEESAQKAVLRRIWDSVGYLVVPVVVVFLLLGVVFSLAWVPTGSM